MSAPASRFLQRLDEAVAAAGSAVEADCFRAEQACFLARQGHFDDARTLLDDLHARYDTRPIIDTSIWINLAEGMMGLYSGDAAVALDRYRRAHALSVAGNIKPLRALSSAWLAHMALNRRDIVALTLYLTEALSLRQGEHHSTQSRMSLVTGHSLHIAGRPDLAAPWYAASHKHASMEHDEATISALMFNMSGARVAQHRQYCLGGSGSLAHGQLALRAAESTRNFDALIGAKSLQSYVPILHAQVLALEGQSEAALTLFETLIADGAQHAAQSRLESCLFADIAWCRAMLGQHELAFGDATSAVVGLRQDVLIDDRAATHSRLAQVFAILGDPASANRHKALADQSWKDYAALQDRIIESLRTVIETGPD